MDTLSIESREPFSMELIESILSAHWRTEIAAANRLPVHGIRDRAYVFPDTESEEAGVYRVLVDYTDVALA